MTTGTKGNNLTSWLLVKLSIAMVAAITLLNSCTPNLSDDPIPPVTFPTIIINLNLPAYIQLQTQGYQYVNGGLRGLIIYKKNSSSYVVFERNCSYHPNEACATVDVDNSGLFMVDNCCGSQFSFPDGNPNGGAAWRPLRKYASSLTGSELTITDEIIE